VGSSSLFGCQRSPGRAAGAPRAWMRSHGLRAHHSRTRDLDYRSRMRKTFNER